MQIPLTPRLNNFTTVVKDVYLQCFPQWVSQSELAKSISRGKIGIPSSKLLKAVNEAQLGHA